MNKPITGYKEQRCIFGGAEVTRQVAETGPVAGAFWTRAVADYNAGKAAALTVYGGSA